MLSKQWYTNAVLADIIKVKGGLKRPSPVSGEATMYPADAEIGRPYGIEDSVGRHTVEENIEAGFVGIYVPVEGGKPPEEEFFMDAIL